MLVNNKSLISLRGIKKYYQVENTKQLVLKGLDLDIEKGESIAILGKSGSGKSTLLNILGLLDQPSDGEYYIEGKNVKNYKGDDLAKFRAQTFGFIFQQFNLLPKLTTIENIVLPVRYTRDRLKYENRYKKAMELLEIVGIPEQANKLPKLLSGGQQQRVAIARSLINEPSVIIGDEPTGALDSKTADQIIEQIFTLNQTLKVTLIIVTHDEDLAFKCRRVIKLKDGFIEEDIVT